MPIHMDGFCLFSEEQTSSLPLNLAYKAAELAAPELADRFLYNLRYATIARPAICAFLIFGRRNLRNNSYL